MRDMARGTDALWGYLGRPGGVLRIRCGVGEVVGAPDDAGAQRGGREQAAREQGQARKDPQLSPAPQDQRFFRFGGFPSTSDKAANPARAIPFFLTSDTSSPGEYPFSR